MAIPVYGYSSQLLFITVIRNGKETRKCQSSICLSGLNGFPNTRYNKIRSSRLTLTGIRDGP